MPQISPMNWIIVLSFFILFMLMIFTVFPTVMKFGVKSNSMFHKSKTMRW